MSSDVFWRNDTGYEQARRSSVSNGRKPVTATLCSGTVSKGRCHVDNASRRADHLPKFWKITRATVAMHRNWAAGEGRSWQSATTVVVVRGSYAAACTPSHQSQARRGDQGGPHQSRVQEPG
jgi:hypothetical protein